MCVITHKTLNHFIQIQFLLVVCLNVRPHVCLPCENRGHKITDEKKLLNRHAFKMKLHWFM